MPIEVFFVENKPDLQALRRKANEKLRAALDPTLARLVEAFSVGFELREYQFFFRYSA